MLPVYVGGSEVIIFDTGQIRQGEHILNLKGERTEPGKRNHVIGERIANLRSVDDVGGIGIEQLAESERLAGRIDRGLAGGRVHDGNRERAGVVHIVEAAGRAEVAASIGWGGHRLEVVVNGSGLAELLKIEEEEGAVGSVVDF